MIAQYFQKIEHLLQKIKNEETDSMKKAAEKVAEAIKHGGIVQLFGCGHSHILTEEVFYRAGGLVPIKPIFHEPLMLHEGAVLSSMLERKNNYAHTFMSRQDIRSGDVFIVLSTSGRNAVPIDVALHAREKGAFVIIITSMEYSNSQPSRHESGKRLYEVGDLVIDNHSVIGDAILKHEKVAIPFSPTSTVSGAVILNGIFAEAIVIMAKEGFTPPVFLSGNIEGADEHNQLLINKYKERIPLLTKGLG
ncbi:SIS domain protein [Anoxybacillus sp. B7M1]|jgi:uncharacterized phosphosugar-binding protein|uniref:UPF0309 protein P9850_16370 n=1 Tax=Anoxybacteroides rupiense TaxID=311460 RepID=A0ABD5J1A1_9BACL|nr:MULTISPECIES: SIS domain-containing protein [Anoxybacillus]ANB55556.1 SIS domain protein [Anoxybacillus sp. B2M1]ANB63238.1 SIS domain protein [Anoxybacillus sp. B7M1]MDE8565572.1 SIS domain-containing protein [Anoxybacillus rupiensis]MED5053371.1 SIS domain-containing protein [Anoxybacillus rupiensis]OQM46694.1 SIS domain-containing protein [Anoxybacillus sp. UARK-01]